MSADFRLRDPKTYAEWYGGEHSAPELIKDAVYGLTEHYRDKIRRARIVALPRLLSDRRAARAPAARQSEADRRGRHHHRCQVGRLRRRPLAEAEHPVLRGGRGAFAVRHRQSSPCAGDRAGVGLAAGGAVTVNFTPHLAPMSRGELCTCYVRLAGEASTADLRKALASAYQTSPSCAWLRRASSRRRSMCAARISAMWASSPTAWRAGPSSSRPSTIW